MPANRLRSLDFHRNNTAEEESENSEQVFLSRSLGRLSFSLQSMNEKELVGIHPSFGKFSIPLDVVKRMNCNQNLKKIRSYLDQLAQARKALEERQPNSAFTILNQANPAFRGWYWGRLVLLAENMQSVEQLSFAPHPEKGLTSVTFAGDSKTILTVGKDGSYGLWNGHARLAEGKFTNPESFPVEIGRFSNEGQKVVTISRPFWLGQTEVTQEQFELIMGKTQAPESNPISQSKYPGMMRRPFVKNSTKHKRLLPATNGGSRPKRNGNMPAGRDRADPFAEANQANCRLKKTPMANTLADSDGLRSIRVGRPTPLAGRNQMPSAYTTCTETFGNGVLMPSSATRPAS